MVPEQSDFLCQGWVWDPLLRELRVHKREKRRWSEEPEETVRLRDVERVRWHRWAQAGRGGGAESLSRIVAKFADGEVTLNENDRECAEKLVSTLASAFGVEVEETGAPGERLPSTVPSLDERGRLVSRQGRTETVVDTAAGEIVETRKRSGFRKSQRRIPFGEVRRVELAHEVKGPLEEYRLMAVYGVEEQRALLALYQGYEGWAKPEEWREFAGELGRTLGVEVVGEGGG
jgi:hypothetical protein